MNSHYTRSQLIEALKRAGLEFGDLVFGHSNIGFFGYPYEVSDINQVCEIIFSAFMEVIGEKGTLVVPTYTYSFPKGEVYDPDKTPGNCGVFAEWLRKHPEASRSAHPCISIAAIGAQREKMTANVPMNGYVEDSFFDRFYRAKGKICNMNFDAASTFIHYVERREHVPYRFDKTFEGLIRMNDIDRRRSCQLWVRYLSSEYTAPDFHNFDQLATARGLYKREQVGRGFVGVISSTDTYDLIKETLAVRPWFLTRAEKAGVVPELLPEEGLF